MAALPVPSFGDYLRHLRAHSPASEAKGGRLSRTEVAAGAFLSVGYVIKLEQGTAENPSPEAVERLAETLGVSAVQRRHLHDLALYRPSQQAAADRAAGTPITPVMEEAADNLLPQLCGYIDDLWNVLYCNDEYARMFRHITKAGNVLRWFFEVPESRSIMVEWDSEARLTVAWFRALMVRRAGDARFGELLEELSRNPEFTRMWLDRDIFMGRHSPYMLLRDLDQGRDVRLLAQVYAWPDPTQAVQMFLGIRTERRP
ncbi:helix-turn-helix transcriptional regulator [Actinomadura hibisca]|uniref:helix-turn-helix transcriptional regulator n=1 Tax=Actinomadura hibisca TaxID=68565 RepID=UPI00082FB376|nr:helix-turn-helix transcriptional regulator [Actinomadura hibisca]